MRRGEASKRKSPRTTVARLSWRQSIQVRGLKIWQGQATSSRFVPGGMAYWNGEAIRKRRSTSLVSLGLNPSGVICEILNDDGTMARLTDLNRFCVRHDLRMIGVAELALYRYECDADQLSMHMEIAS